MSSGQPPWVGVVTGIVKEVDAATATIKAEFAWMQPPQLSHSARIATLMSGGGRGVYYLPEIGDEVLIAFDHGQFEFPYVVGYLWNGPDRPPANDAHLRLIHSVNGHEIALYDPPPSQGDQGYVRISDAHGNRIELANGRISITGIGALQLQAPAVTINGRPVAPVGPPI